MLNTYISARTSHVLNRGILEGGPSTLGVLDRPTKCMKRLEPLALVVNRAVTLTLSAAQPAPVSPGPARVRPLATCL